MSNENLERFMIKILRNKDLEIKIPHEIDKEALIALGAECGCEFTAEDLQDSAAMRRSWRRAAQNTKVYRNTRLWRLQSWFLDSRRGSRLYD